MREVQCIFLIPLAAAAVLWDIKEDRIPNWLIVAGLAVGWSAQLVENGFLGILWFLGGAGIPVVLCAFAYYFRMMGAGDIKLLAAACCFLRPEKAVMCVTVSFFSGAVFAVILLCARRNARERIHYFCKYVKDIKTGKGWRSYLSDQDTGGRMHFSMGIFAAVLMYAGGVY